MSANSTSTGQAVNILTSVGTGTRAVNIATGAVASTTTIGNTTGASRVVVSAGTGLIVETGAVVRNRTAAAINATATATAAQVAGGLITSTSAAATTITLPTATAILALVSGGGIGTTVDFIVDNSQGASTVTVALDASITAVASPVITGGGTLTLVGSGTNEVGMFRLYFYSATAATIARIY